MFCRKARKMTAEHLFPEWVLELFDRAESELSFWDEEAGTNRVAGRMTEIEVRRVCKGCNEGWMSNIESRVAPILRPFILGDAGELDHAEQLLAAAWVVKTAMVGEWTVPSVHAISQNDRDYVYNHRKPPPLTHIWLAAWSKAEEPPLSFETHQFGFLPDGKTALPRRGYLATFFIGHLGCQVLGHPFGSVNVDDGNFGPAVVQIWPVAAESVRWPPRAAIGSEKTLKVFAKRFGSA